MKKDKYEKTQYPNIWKNKENGTYAIDISLGYDAKGKRIRTTRTGIEKEKEARNILNDIKKKNEMKSIITENAKFEDLLEEYYDWLLYSKKIKESSLRTKKSRFNSRILPFFKGMKIISIKGKDIERYHNYLNTIKKENGNPLDSETKNSLHKILSAYFNWIVKHKDIIYINPCQSVFNFKIDKKEIKYYKLEELEKIIEAIDNDIDNKDIYTKLFAKAVVKGLFFSGFRLGEFMGLKFKDIEYDLINKNSLDKDIIKVSINQTVSYGKGGWTVTDGKTRKSLRSIYMGKNALQPIFDYIKFWQNNGITYSENDFIFENPISNKIISPTQIRNKIYYYIDKAGINRIKLKNFRHSYATLLLSSGYRLEDVKEELGHVTLNTTEKNYATLYDENKKNIAKYLDKLL